MPLISAIRNSNTGENEKLFKYLHGNKLTKIQNTA